MCVCVRVCACVCASVSVCVSCARARALVCYCVYGVAKVFYLSVARHFAYVLIIYDMIFLQGESPREGQLKSRYCGIFQYKQNKK